MATNAQLMARLASGDKLDPAEVQQLERAIDRYDRFAQVTQNHTQLGGSRLQITQALEVIYSETLTVDTASIEIPIPGGYKHLFVMGSGRINGTGGQTSLAVMMQFNGDTGATNYEWGRLYHLGATVTGEQDLGDPSMRVWSFAADGEATNSFPGAFFMFIPHYQSAWYKMVLDINGVGLSTAVFDAMRQGLWLSTNKIESILIFPDPAFASAKFQSGTLISVYGIL